MQVPLEELVPLRSIEAEMSVLGSMLLSDRAAEEVANILSDDDFYQPAHQEIYRAMRQLVDNAKPVDLVTLKDELTARDTLRNIGGVEYLVQVLECVPSAANAVPYARIVQDKATMRRLERAGRDIVGVVHNSDIVEADDKVDKAEQLVFEVGRKRLGKDFQHIQSLAKEFFLDVDHILETGEPMVGTSSGFYELDDMTTGFYPGDFVIVAARPSMGKTALVLNFALNVARKNVGNVAVFSLEMSGPQLVRRLVSMSSQVSSSVLRKSSLSDDDYKKLADACELLYGLPIYIDDSSDVSGMEIRGKCRRLKQEGGLGLVVVDYLQLMRSSKRAENRVQEISEIARSLKALAKELQVPVIALSQLNRSVESRDNKRPMLSDIRESGSIEAEADLVMFIYRESYYEQKKEGAPDDYNPMAPERAEVIIAKHRNGPTGTIILGFQPAFANFVNAKF
jgi:replicative DNA helicase